MAEFSLPANSKVAQDGRIFKAPAGPRTFASSSVPFRPPTSRDPRLDSRSRTIDACGRRCEDALIKIKTRSISTLSFRARARRICGSVPMNIDGKNALACVSACADVKHDIKIYPLPHMPVIKDLIPD